MFFYLLRSINAPTIAIAMIMATTPPIMYVAISDVVAYPVGACVTDGVGVGDAAAGPTVEGCCCVAAAV